MENDGWTTVVALLIMGVSVLTFLGGAVTDFLPKAEGRSGFVIDTLLNC